MDKMDKGTEQGRIKDLLRTNPHGLTIEEVSKTLGISRPTTAKYLNALVVSGQADIRELGRAKLFSICQRVPITKVLSLSTDLILILDTDLAIREINEPALSFFGMETGDLKGKRLEYSPLAAHFSRDLITSIKNALNGEESIHEITFESIDTGRFFRCKCIPLVFIEGSHAAGLILEDITRMKNYQQELEERVLERAKEVVSAKEYAESLIQAANAMIIILDGKGRITLANRAAEEISGYSHDELLKSKWSDLIPREQFPRIWEMVSQATVRGVPGKSETPLLTKSGKVRHISWNNTVIRDGDRIREIISFGIDITDKKIAEEALLESQRELETLMGNLPGMAFRCRNDPEWTMEFVSEGCSDLTEYSPVDLINNRSIAFSLTIHPQDRQMVYDMIQAALKKKKRYQIEYRIRTASGKSKWVWEQGTGVFSPSGEVILIEGFIIDISAKKYAEDVVKKAQKQVALLTSITRHDIMNQLSALTGFITFQKKRTKDPEVLDLIDREMKIAETILQQITFTRDFQNVGMEPPRWVNLQSAIRKVLAIINLNDVEVIADLGNLEVYTDPLIEKVFYTLLDNSLKHAGHLTLIRISYKIEETGISLMFEDNGVGIPDNEKELIFTRGYGKNTGYGLFIVREILAMSDFTISENGLAGKGARFTISIPPESYRFA
ncbi:MAG TPA: PAS domain S-box protein [Methanoregula sp.]|nr:PAS domain S-box protein [Methanoregula sp.]